MFSGKILPYFVLYKVDEKKTIKDLKNVVGMVEEEKESDDDTSSLTESDIPEAEGEGESEKSQKEENQVVKKPTEVIRKY